MGVETTQGHAVLWWTILVAFLTQIASASRGDIVKFEVQLENFTNAMALDTDGNCCSGIRDSSLKCTSPCRTFFRVCFTHFQREINLSPCTFGSVETPVFGDGANSFIFPDTLDAFNNPIVFPMSSAWPGTFVIIVDALHDKTADGPYTNSPRQLISRLIIREDIKLGSPWKRPDSTAEVAGPNKAKLSIRYRVSCMEHFYGPSCELTCTARNDAFGHYTCDEHGNHVCMEGFQGSYCEKPICLAGCSSDHGKCDSPNECKCNKGWQGTLCDECIPYPGCQHGTCNNTPWACKCKEGWGGLFCNLDLNFCTHNKPCKNGATCQNAGKGSYKCMCPRGFTGNNCEIQIDDCLHQPCMNGGTCADAGADYRCRCPLGYHGRHCESSATSCDENPCMNQGTCADRPGGGYSCHCRPGYSGINCEQNVNECASSPCVNGKCVDDLAGFHCYCLPGFSGESCEKNDDDCIQEPCQNGGTCKDKDNSYECRCIPGFVGALCEDNVDDCQMMPCANGGTCHDLLNDFQCDCAPGFSGKDCRNRFDECSSSPCLNGGTCDDGHNEFMCHCQEGFHGVRCESMKPLHDIPDMTTKRPNVGANGGPSLDQPTTPPAQGEVTGGHMGAIDQTVITMKQLLFIVCLGIGIPIIIIIIIIVVLVYMRQRNNNNQQDTTHMDNERNEIRNINNLNTVSQYRQGSKPPNLKITNEEQDHINNTKNSSSYHAYTPSSPKLSSSHPTPSAKTLINPHHLNVDQSSCNINKNYIKDNISKRTKELYSDSSPGDVRVVPSSNLSECSNPLERGGSVLGKSLADIGEYGEYGSSHSHHAEVHSQKVQSSQPYSRDSSSIFIVPEKHSASRHSPYHREGMLATEV